MHNLNQGRLHVPDKSGRLQLVGLTIASKTQIRHSNVAHVSNQNTSIMHTAKIEPHK